MDYCCVMFVVEFDYLICEFSNLNLCMSVYMHGENDFYHMVLASKPIFEEICTGDGLLSERSILIL